MNRTSSPLLELTASGLYCAAGDFFIDPWPRKDTPVECAVITHGHADHARFGAAHYISTPDTVEVMLHRISRDLSATSYEYGETFKMGKANVSFHPAGHVLGSAQVRVEVDGEVWVVTGDFKRAADPTCTPFEPVVCDTLITEATFSLPIYHWRPGAEVVADIAEWWQLNAEKGRASVLFCYAFGKAQRILAELLPHTSKVVFLHGAMVPLVQLYRELGVEMVNTQPVSDLPRTHSFAGELVLAPPSAAGSPWMRRFAQHSSGFVSGWMQVRGNRRRRGYDRGFVMSDHADWPGLMQTVTDSQATRVLATHGKTDSFVRYLRESGIDAADLAMPYGDEED